MEKVTGFLLFLIKLRSFPILLNLIKTVAAVETTKGKKQEKKGKEGENKAKKNIPVPSHVLTNTDAEVKLANINIG